MSVALAIQFAELQGVERNSAAWQKRGSRFLPVASGKMSEFDFEHLGRKWHL